MNRQEREDLGLLLFRIKHERGTTMIWVACIQVARPTWFEPVTQKILFTKPIVG
jgi:hypothetical protein